LDCQELGASNEQKQITGHVRSTDAALKAGASKQEIAEALGVAMAMNAGLVIRWTGTRPSPEVGWPDSSNFYREGDARGRLSTDGIKSGALAATSEKGTRHGQHKKCQYRYSQDQYDHGSDPPKHRSDVQGKVQPSKAVFSVSYGEHD
jgi:hypothetical protein